MDTQKKYEGYPATFVKETPLLQALVSSGKDEPMLIISSFSQLQEDESGIPVLATGDLAEIPNLLADLHS